MKKLSAILAIGALFSAGAADAVTYVPGDPSGPVFINPDPGGITYVETAFKDYYLDQSPIVYLHLSAGTLDYVFTASSDVIGNDQYGVGYAFFDPIAFIPKQNNTYLLYVPTYGQAFTGEGDSSDGFAVYTTTSFSYTFTSSAPEPSSWITMLLGFAVTGSLLRRKFYGKAQSYLA